MKTIIIALFLLSSVAFSQWNGTVINLISDDAVTDTNDSLETGWIDIGDANAVELFMSVDDTVDIRFYVDYAVGNGGTYYVTMAIDSIKVNWYSKHTGKCWKGIEKLQCYKPYTGRELYQVQSLFPECFGGFWYIQGLA